MAVVHSDIKLALILRSYIVPLAITSKILIEKRKALPGTELINVRRIPYLSLIMSSPQDWQ